MSSTIAVIDSQVAGISGDMLLSSLVDAGANKNKVVDAILSCQDFLAGSKIADASFAKTVSHGFSATEFRFSYKDSVHERKGIEMYRSISRCCDSLNLELRAKTFALESMKTIISAEALIHGEKFDEVHLHEASSIDTLTDIVGCATALQDLGLFNSKVYSTSVAVGGGLLKFSHGTVSNPASAILEIFRGKGFTLAGGQASEELTTPTGAAMLVNLASESIIHYPAFSPEKIGYGAGTKKFKNIPNVLKIVIGSSPLLLNTNRDTVSVIETNVDDASGEVIGNVVDQITEAGAKDVSVVTGITKKNRPTYMIKIICDNSQVNEMIDILFRESGTLGARVQQVERYVLPRAIVITPVNIHGSQFNVHVKVVKDSQGATIGAKPEFEDVKIIAARLGISAKKALELVNLEIAKSGAGDQ